MYSTEQTGSLHRKKARFGKNENKTFQVIPRIN